MERSPSKGRMPSYCESADITIVCIPSNSATSWRHSMAWRKQLESKRKKPRLRRWQRIAPPHPSLRDTLPKYDKQIWIAKNKSRCRIWGGPGRGRKVNIMKKNNLLARYDKHLRVHMHYPEARKEVTKDVVRFIRNAPGMNFVSFTFADEPDLERVIDQQLDYFLPMEQPFTWKVYDHDLLPSLKDKLVSRNFVGDDDPAAVMVLKVKHAPNSLLEPVT